LLGGLCCDGRLHLYLRRSFGRPDLSRLSGGRLGRGRLGRDGFLRNRFGSGRNRFSDGLGGGRRFYGRHLWRAFRRWSSGNLAGRLGRQFLHFLPHGFSRFCDGFGIGRCRGDQHGPGLSRFCCRFGLRLGLTRWGWLRRRLRDSGWGWRYGRCYRSRRRRLGGGCDDRGWWRRRNWRRGRRRCRSGNRRCRHNRRGCRHGLGRRSRTG